MVRVGENEVLKKLAVAAFAASSMMVAVPQAAVAGPEDGCTLGCVWIATADNPEKHWVCGVPICQDQVEP